MDPLKIKHFYDITLVRHGQTALNERQAFVGITDDPLTETGIQQAHITGQFLQRKNYEFDIGFTSTLLRASQTATIIQQYINVDIQTEPLLKERSYGIFEGKTAEELAQMVPEIYHKYEKNKPFTRPPEGESAYEVESRIKELFWSKIQSKFNRGTQDKPTTRILAVTHLNPIRALLRLLKLADWQIYYQRLKNTSITQIRTDLISGEILLFDYSCMEDNECASMQSE